MLGVHLHIFLGETSILIPAKPSLPSYAVHTCGSEEGGSKNKTRVQFAKQDASDRLRPSPPNLIPLHLGQTLSLRVSSTRFLLHTLFLPVAGLATLAVRCSESLEKSMLQLMAPTTSSPAR